MSSPIDEPEFDPFAHDSPKKKPGGSGIGVAWLALLFGVLAIAASGYQWWLDRAVNSAEQNRQLAISTLQRSQSGFQQMLESYGSRLESTEQRDDPGAFASIRSELQTIQTRLTEAGLDSADDQAMFAAAQASLMGLQQRIDALEASVAALAVRSDTPGKRMDVAEVDYLLRLAAERLTMFGDVRSADHALEIAATQLEALNDPLYLPVRRAITRSRQVLQDHPSLDLIQISTRIEALQSSIPALPFRGETVLEPVAESAVDAGLWQRIKNALSPLIKVRRSVNEDLVLALDDKDILRQGLWLQLESARLALMRSDAGAWAWSLTRARDTLEERFEISAEVVRAAVVEIDQLFNIVLVQQLPDISVPWSQLRLLREGRALSTPDEAASDQESHAPVGEEGSEAGGAG